MLVCVPASNGTMDVSLYPFFLLIRTSQINESQITSPKLYSTKVWMNKGWTNTKSRGRLMKIRFYCFFRNCEGDLPVHFLKKALKLAGSKKPSR